jgi:hypothetical protein
VAVFNPGTREHGFLNMGQDIVTTDKDFYKEAAMVTEAEHELLDLFSNNPDYDPGDLTEAERSLLGLAEKSSTDHPYGAWKGGSKGAGGGMEGKEAVKSPKGEPGSPERAKDVDSQLKSLRVDAGVNDHVEVRTISGGLVTGRLSSRQPGEIEVREFRDGQGYANIPIKTKNISHVRVSPKPWLNTSEKGVGWVREGSPAQKAFAAKATKAAGERKGALPAYLQKPGGASSTKSGWKPVAKPKTAPRPKGVLPPLTPGGPKFTSEGERRSTWASLSPEGRAFAISRGYQPPSGA